MDDGLSTLELAEISPELRKIVRIVLREGEISHDDLRRAVQDLPEEQRITQVEFEDALNKLERRRWLIRVNTEDAVVIYRVNLRRRSSRVIVHGIWEALGIIEGMIDTSEPEIKLRRGGNRLVPDDIWDALTTDKKKGDEGAPTPREALQNLRRGSSSQPKKAGAGALWDAVSGDDDEDKDADDHRHELDEDGNPIKRRTTDVFRALNAVQDHYREAQRSGTGALGKRAKDLFEELDFSSSDKDKKESLQTDSQEVAALEPDEEKETSTSLLDKLADTQEAPSELPAGAAADDPQKHPVETPQFSDEDDKEETKGRRSSRLLERLDSLASDEDDDDATPEQSGSTSS